MPGPLPNRRPEASPWPMVVAMIVASLGVHLLLWPLGNRVLELGWPAATPPPTDDLLEVSLVPVEEPERDAESLLPGQLVKPDRVLDQRKPEEPTDRISEFDSRVEHETRAPNRRPAPEYDPRTLGEQAGRSSTAEQGTPEPPVQPHALPLGQRTDGPVEGAGHRADDPLPEGDDGTARSEAGARAPRPSLRGTAEAMRKTFGGSGSMDALDGVDEGSESLINSERFRFASFFNRMRDQVAQHWEPNEVMQRVDADGRTYGRSTRKTLLHVKLTAKGAIQKINVLHGSGVIELDKEAIRAFHQAAPFVNPPPEMVDASTGLIEFDFLFILDDGGKTTLRRYLR